MSKVSIELDLKVVQTAINAKVAPAVAAVLSTVDLPGLIEGALLKEAPKPSRYASLISIFDDRAVGSARAIDGMIDAAIHDIAKEYVKTAVEGERPRIEAAFEKALRASQSKLAKTMVSTLVDGLEADWSFELQTTATVKEPERSYD